MVERSAQWFYIQNFPSKSISLAVKPRACRSSIASSGVWREGTRAGPKRSSPMRPSLLAERVVRPRFYPDRMSKSPSRIDLLELDIDLRLTDLWREAAEITDWNLDVVAAFMRAAYGKGYCDALTEDAPGSLCHDHGYRIPARRAAPAAGA